MGYEKNTSTECSNNEHFLGVEFMIGTEIIGSPEDYEPTDYRTDQLFAYCPNCGIKLNWPASINLRQKDEVQRID